MTANRKFHGILSLSAASIALGQSISAKGQPLDQALVDSADSLNAQNGPKAANLVLAPAHHEELIRLYADHASHASHSSHASHYSGSDSGSDYSVPATSAPATPDYSQPQPPPTQSQPVAPVLQTNSVSQTVVPPTSVNSTNQTNVLGATNTV
jgi:hypothetical protein